MKRMLMLCGILLFGLAGCATPVNQTAKAESEREMRCQTGIKYSGRRLEITGIKVPKGGGVDAKVIELGNLSWGDVQVQKASTIAQALDIMQFGDCALLEQMDDKSKVGLAWLKGAPIR